MRKLLGIMLVAVLAVAAVTATAAQAERENPEMLPNPTPTAPVKFEGLGTKASLNSSLGMIESTVTKIKGEFTSTRLGTISLDFLEAKDSGIRCNSVGDEKSTILVVSADVELVDILPSKVLSLGIAVTPAATVLIKCGTVAAELTGTAIGQIDGVTDGTEIPHETAVSILFHPTVTGGTTQEFTTCDLTKAFCSGKSYELLASFGSGFKAAALEQPAEISFNKTVSFDF